VSPGGIAAAAFFGGGGVAVGGGCFAARSVWAGGVLLWESAAALPTDRSKTLRGSSVLGVCSTNDQQQH
jgi:hypothetical protein